MITTISVTDKFIEIKGQKYTLENLDDLLNQIEVYSIQPRSAIAIGAGGAVIYYIPGVGQVAVLATGAILIGGVTITVGHWAYKKVKAYLASEHKKMHVLVLMINILNLDPDA